MATRKTSFTFMAKEATFDGKDIDARAFKKHKKQYAQYKLNVLNDFQIKDHDNIILSALMSCKSYIEMDRIARRYIETKLS